MTSVDAYRFIRKPPGGMPLREFELPSRFDSASLNWTAGKWEGLEMQRWHVTGRRGEFEKLENRCVLAALLPGEAVFPSPRSIIDYGGSVEFDGGRAFVGDIGEDALFVMRRVDGQWQTESVVEPPGQLDFPYAVLARGDVLVAESIDDIDDDATIDLARLYELHDGQWQEKLTVNC